MKSNYNRCEQKLAYCLAIKVTVVFRTYLFTARYHDFDAKEQGVDGFSDKRDRIMNNNE